MDVQLLENPQACGACGLVTLITGILAVTSLKAVPPLSYGIRYNAFTKAADTAQVYTNGRYLVGFWNNFVLFPASVRNIEFANDPQMLSFMERLPPLHSRTKEGLSLHLQISIQYKLQKEHIGQLYAEFNQQYESVYVSTIRDVLIKTAANYHGAQFWEEREQMGTRMQEAINKELEVSYATCWGLQLMVIELPTRFEDAIVNTQVQKQLIVTHQNEQKATQIRAQTRVIEANFRKQVKVLVSRGQGNFSYITQVAKAKARRRVIELEAEVMGRVSKNLGLAPADLVKYQRYTAINQLGNASILYGFDNTPVIVQGSPRSQSPTQPQAPADSSIGVRRLDMDEHVDRTFEQRRSDEL